MTQTRRGSQRLRPGLIFEIAQQAGVPVPHRGAKRSIPCPLHDDEHASAFLSESNVFYCSVCTPDGGWTARRLAESLDVRWPHERPQEVGDTGFTADLARAVWDLALERARSDDHVDTDRLVYEYLERRGLAESWEYGSYGVLAEGMNLPATIQSWPQREYRLICPLFDLDGDLVNLQGRAIGVQTPRTLFPRDSRAKGAVFANSCGLDVIRGSGQSQFPVILGEGLTDHLALTLTCSHPVLSAPGTSLAVSAIGPWVRERVLLVALDADEAGDRAVRAVANAAYAFGATSVLRVKWEPPYHDACDVLLAAGPVTLSRWIEHQLTEFHDVQ